MVSLALTQPFSNSEANRYLLHKYANYKLYNFYTNNNHVHDPNHYLKPITLSWKNPSLTCAKNCSSKLCLSYSATWLTMQHSTLLGKCQLLMSEPGYRLLCGTAANGHTVSVNFSAYHVRVVFVFTKKLVWLHLLAISKLISCTFRQLCTSLSSLF